MMIRKRTTINFFISYAHSDDDYSGPFIEEFKEMTAPSHKYQYVFWQDTEILPGGNWKNEIQQALNNCSLGLLLISSAFLGSDYIEEEELPKFIDDQTKAIIPVMLKMVNFKRHNLKGLKKYQIFRFKAEGSKKLKSFAQCGTSQRTDFVYELFDKVEARLDKIFS